MILKRVRFHALIVLQIVFSTCGLTSNANPSEDHLNLAAASAWAVTTSNTELMKALLQAGLQINEPVANDSGLSLLHLAVMSGNERMVRFVVDNGAILDIRSKTGSRPIDIAYEEGLTNICQLLTYNVEDKRSVDEFPAAMLENAFTCEPITNSVLVSVNGKKPTDNMLNWLRTKRGWTHALACSEPRKATEQIRDAQSRADPNRNISVYYYSMEIKKVTENEYLCRWGLDLGQLSGGWGESALVKKFGYWLVSKRTGGEF